MGPSALTRPPGIRSWRSGPESSEREESFPALGSETLKSQLGPRCYQTSFSVREGAVLWLETSGENHLMVAAPPGHRPDAVFSGENRGGFDGLHLKRCPADRGNAAALQAWGTWSLAAAGAGVAKAKLSDRVI